MKSSKRTIAIIAAGGVLALALTSCAPSVNPAKSVGPVSIGFWSWVPGVDTPTKVWNAANPSIQVKHDTVAYGDVWTKARAAIGAGNAPCLVAAARTDIPQLVSEGLLEDVTDVAAKYKNEYLSFAWNETAVAGHEYGLPWDSGPATYFYRSDIFKKANVTPPQTWDQLVTVAQAVKASSPSSKILWLPADAIQDFSNYAEQAGANWFTVKGDTWKVDMTDAKTMQVVSTFQTLIDDGLVSTKLTSDPSLAADAKSGALAGILRGSWTNGQIAGWDPDNPGQWSAAQPPVWANNSSYNSGGSALLVTKGCAHPKEALDYAHWLTTSKDSYATLGTPAGGGLYPAAVKALDYSVFNKPSAYFGNEVLGKVFSQSAKSITVGSKWNWPPVWADLAAGMADDYASAVNGKEKLADVMKKAETMAVSLMKARGINAELAH